MHHVEVGMNVSHREVFAFEGQIDARKQVPSLDVSGAVQMAEVANVTHLVSRKGLCIE